MDTVERITQEVKQLPEGLAQEVLDFIEYLAIKHGLKDLDTYTLQRLQEKSLGPIGDNEEDEIWNDA